MNLSTSESVILAIQNLPPTERKKVFDWIDLQTSTNELDEESKFWLSASSESLKKFWETPNESVWNNLFDNRLKTKNVTN